MADFPVAGPELISARSLQKRVDTKFVIAATKVEAFLESLGQGFAVLESNGVRAALYRTQYFDSPDFAFLMQHHRGRRPRFKVRLRNYLDRDLSYVEVKQKTPKNITVKVRKVREESDLSLDPTDRRFLADSCPIPNEVLEPQVLTVFRRVTLVGIDEPERVTLDMGLSFSTETRSAELPDICVVEIKQPRFRARSECFLALRRLNARPAKFSKYFTGATLLCDVPRRRQLMSKIKRFVPA